MGQNFEEDYRRKGFAVVKNVFTSQEIADIRSEATIALTKAHTLREQGYKHSPLDVRTNSRGREYPAISFWPCLLSGYLESIRIDPRLASIVHRILGPNVKQLNNQFYFHLRGEEDSFNWHQDIMFRHPLDQYPRIVEEDNYMQTAIIVDEFSDKVSPLWMVPGSYQLGNLKLLETPQGEPDYVRLRNIPDLTFPSRELGLEPEVLKAEPGDVAIWCSLTVHASLPGSEEGHRAYYMNGFAVSRNARGWPLYTQNAIPIKLDARKIP
jgi:ectoine hydroxylase-related dioxygenase (phytanoyl-CoA dioxygenase family)